MVGGVTALAAVIVLLSAPSQALHNSTVWTHVLSACSPDEASVGRYFTHVSVFKHARGAAGHIVARCNVVNLPRFGSYGDGPVLEVVYRDQDGSSRVRGVRADLIEARPNGATVTVARFSSNDYRGSARMQRRWVSLPDGFHFSFERNAYYVTVRVTRSRSALRLAPPQASTVRLTGRVL